MQFKKGMITTEMLETVLKTDSGIVKTSDLLSIHAVLLAMADTKAEKTKPFQDAWDSLQNKYAQEIDKRFPIESRKRETNMKKYGSMLVAASADTINQKMAEKLNELSETGHTLVTVVTFREGNLLVIYELPAK